MNTAQLNVVEIYVKRNPINDRWGIYRVYREGNALKEMLWTTSIIRKGAVQEAEKQAKLFDVNIRVDPKLRRK